jgi:uncharacterized protein (DUF983 family)
MKTIFNLLSIIIYGYIISLLFIKFKEYFSVKKWVSLTLIILSFLLIIFLMLKKVSLLLQLN